MCSSLEPLAVAGGYGGALVRVKAIFSGKMSHENFGRAGTPDCFGV